MSKYVIQKSDDTNKADRIVKISDEYAKKVIEAGKQLFNSYEDAIQSRGESESVEMNKVINKARFKQIPEVAKRAGQLVLPATYEALRHGNEPGFKESSIDAALMSSNLIPGGRLLRSTPVVGKVATSIERSLLANETPILKYALPKLANVPTSIVGEGVVSTGIEGLTSIAQDREFDPMNVAYGTGLGVVAGQVLPGERTRMKTLEAMKTVPGSILDERLITKSGITAKPGETVSKIANKEIESVLTKVLKDNGLSKIDISNTKISDALKTRVKNLIRNDKSQTKLGKELLINDVDRYVDDYVSEVNNMAASTLAQGRHVLPRIEEPIASQIKRSAPVAVADALNPNESQYLLELGRQKSFDTSIPEASIIGKVPFITPLLGLAGNAAGAASTLGRTYFPTLSGLDERE